VLGAVVAASRWRDRLTGDSDIVFGASGARLGAGALGFIVAWGRPMVVLAVALPLLRW